MEKLTLEQKQIIVNTNYYICKFNGNIKENAYGDDAAYKMLDMWLSDILELDYKNDIYNSSKVTELNKIERVKKVLSAKFQSSWFIGDVMKDKVYSLCYYKKDSEADILAMEAEVKQMWEFFKGLTIVFETNPPEPKFQYLPAGVTLYGEELYKKVSV